MLLTDALKEFIRQHTNDDLNDLLLKASRYPGIDIPFVVDQLSARRQIKEKLPTWYCNEALIFPSKIAAEQCSSEPTAYYKQRLVNSDDHLVDLTGGLGVDTWAFSQKVKKVTYIERFPTYCKAASHNFKHLNASNIQLVEGDATQIIQTLNDIDVIYIDPARRKEGNKRAYALQECEPDLISLLPVLFEKAPRIIAKISPMADIRLTSDLLPKTTAIHILSVKNECKELLFVLEKNKAVETPFIHCINFTTANKEESFEFTLIEEQSATAFFIEQTGTYLYEPNASILKAGAFKSVSTQFGLGKIAVSSHLYSSNQLIETFPGRIFQIEEIIPFNNKAIKQFAKNTPQANITVRNFPLSVDELRKRTGIKDGGSIYLFATTTQAKEKIILRCCQL
ncbi:RsmD family RNA methyltransferase [Parabacteroides sp. PF5-9]|uniref:class I SAM-dependent methyltransferase n=1 Tax=Parabacteroides sp. PF5-9 TaxID=1742404 RepID=UPI0024743D43|nr:RsmD family RNA methyltransferase [Parabacteroides sp. PF5-9]MDH6357563.1 hypothetical protein [Parabacteroides sp. PF5-9]